jgi:GAF domain-containing protein
MHNASADELRRLQALRDLSCDKGEHVAALDHVAQVAIQHFKVPIAIVSLLDDKRQYFAGRQGTPLDGTPIGDSFCRFTILSDDVFVVEDAMTDPRFANSPLVTGEPHIRFYAGAPLIMENGVRLGAACIIDQRPRTLNVGQKVVLKQLAKIALAELKDRAAALSLSGRAQNRPEPLFRLRASNS